MKLEELTEEHIVEIVRLYEQYCGNNRPFCKVTCSQPPAKVLEGVKAQFASRGCCEYRYGSRWSFNSKLWIRHRSGELWIFFDPNMHGGMNEEKAEAAGKEFDQAVLEYTSQQEGQKK